MLPSTTISPKLQSLKNSEQELLTRIRYQHDQQAFALIFNQYYSWLCERAYPFCQCEQKAKEIVLDVFTKLWNRKDEISTDTQLKSYLFIAVRNRALDYFRQAQLHQKRQANVQVFYTEISESPEEGFICEEFTKAVELAINNLPPQGQYIFRLSRERNLKYREIAEELSISIKTVETHMRRAFIQLREELSPWLHPR
ncbi:MAG TPA: RNA polymerase sigma-70 factor [Saprospiraceae bacterium]|nr:RNA polymerase sigma-70 factor [Saprospiraceae bacterium]HMQ81444.1 RNA polymerase sigma-70 factor [Saprospiraceae bacterium]